jgi:hypothetical protein
MIIGPVLMRSGGYGFDIWTPANGVAMGCSYRRIEDAYYDRRLTANGSRQIPNSAAIICETVDTFQVEVERFKRTVLLVS